MRILTSQSGNALWFILIAVALLGLLTVAMTRSGGSSNETGSYEQNQIAANEILSYASSIESAVQSLIARGCSENDISFWHDSDGNGTENGSDTYYNSNSPADHSCHVFEPEGTGMSYTTPNLKSLNNGYSAALLSGGSFGSFRFQSGHTIADIETTQPELTLHLNFLKKDVCMQINSILNVQNLANDAPSDTVGLPSLEFFTGSYGTPMADPLGDDTNGYLTGKRSFCWLNSGNGVYQFVTVLNTR